MSQPDASSPERSTEEPARKQSLCRSFRNAFMGLADVVRTQRNARIHIAAALAVVAMSVWLRLPLVEWAARLLVIGCICAAEIFNSALEAIVDLVSPEYHGSAKRAKDAAAAAVLVLALIAVLLGLLLLGPPLLERLTQ